MRVGMQSDRQGLERTLPQIVSIRTVWAGPRVAQATKTSLLTIGEGPSGSVFVLCKLGRASTHAWKSCLAIYRPYRQQRSPSQGSEIACFKLNERKLAGVSKGDRLKLGHSFDVSSRYCICQLGIGFVVTQRCSASTRVQYSCPRDCIATAVAGPVAILRQKIW